MAMRDVALSVCLVIALAHSAPARDIYVNNLAGDDRSSGDGPNNAIGLGGPVRTIAKATRIAGPGDRIVLAATEQPYRESVSLVGLRLSASPVSPLLLAGNGAILDGSRRFHPRAGSILPATCFAFARSGSAINNCFWAAVPRYAGRRRAWRARCRRSSQASGV